VTDYVLSGTNQPYVLLKSFPLPLTFRYPGHTCDSTITTEGKVILASASLGLPNKC